MPQIERGYRNKNFNIEWMFLNPGILNVFPHFGCMQLFTLLEHFFDERVRRRAAIVPLYYVIEHDQRSQISARTVHNVEDDQVLNCKKDA